MDLSHNKFSEKAGENLGFGISKFDKPLLLLLHILSRIPWQFSYKSTVLDFR